MRKTNWCDIMDFYNEVFGTHYTKPAAMMQACYRKFGNLEEASLKLGISSETLRLQMKTDGCNIVSQGKWRRKRCLKGGDDR